MTMPDEYGRCLNCGAPCDGDVCDQFCANEYELSTSHDEDNETPDDESEVPDAE